ncbi:MAG: hypothetical protein ABI579_00165 [Candidatus Sumerlaeota bacterium]
MTISKNKIIIGNIVGAVAVILILMFAWYDSMSENSLFDRGLQAAGLLPTPEELRKQYKLELNDPAVVAKLVTNFNTAMKERGCAFELEVNQMWMQRPGTEWIWGTAILDDDPIASVWITLISPKDYPADRPVIAMSEGKWNKSVLVAVRLPAIISEFGASPKRLERLMEKYPCLFEALSESTRSELAEKIIEAEKTSQPPQ